LDQMGRSSLDNNTRFADTFLHPWESRATIKQWFDLWTSCGLKPVALYDRYAELDDLPNTLWQCPTSDDLTTRALDLRFENNLEVWLCHADMRPTANHHAKTNAQIPLRLRLTMPPSQLRRFSETSEISFGAKLTLWQGLLRSLHGHHDRAAIALLHSMDLSVARRLARIGLITPQTAQDAGMLDALTAPMTSSMSPPTLARAFDHRKTEDVFILCAKLQNDQQRVRLATQRFLRAL
jgi:hypothetical protein